MSVRDRLVGARIGLLCNRPFFGSMATRLELVEEPRVKTAAVDGFRFFYNSEFIAGLQDDELEFLFAHEVLHCCFEHFVRRSDRRARVWNFAADFVINQILVDDQIGKFIEGGLLDDRYRNWTTEKVYEDLLSRSNADPQLLDGWESGLVIDEHRECDLDVKEVAQLREAMVAAVSMAGGAHAGKLPAGLLRHIKHLTEPKLNWRELLQQNLQSAMVTDFTYQRPNRKSQHAGVVLPGLVKGSSLHACVAIDTSGSISDEDCRDFLSEVAGIVSQFESYEIRIWCFDTKVYNVQVFTSENSDEIEGYGVVGGGGTSFDCNWEYMKEEGIVPERFVMFTDGYTGDGWGDSEYCEALFVVKTGAGDGGEHPVAPHGMTVAFEG